MINYQVNDENHCFFSYERFFDVAIGAEVSMPEWMGKVTEADRLTTLYSECLDQKRGDELDYSCDSELSAAKYIGPDARTGDDEESVDQFSFGSILSGCSGLAFTLLFVVTFN